jgi:amidase
MRIARWFLAAAIAAGLVFTGVTPAPAHHPRSDTVLRGIDLERATVLDLQKAMNRGRLSSV